MLILNFDHLPKQSFRINHHALQYKIGVATTSLVSKAELLKVAKELFKRVPQLNVVYVSNGNEYIRTGKWAIRPKYYRIDVTTTGMVKLAMWDKFGFTKAPFGPPPVSYVGNVKLKHCGLVNHYSPKHFLTYYTDYVPYTTKVLL